jgi:FkbM family methyltransferase
LFCASQFGCEVLAFLSNNSVAITAFVDNDPKKIGTEIDGVPVVSAQTLADNSKNKIIVICTEIYFREIFTQLLSLGITINSICDAQFKHSIKPRIIEFSDSLFGGILNVYNKIEDTRSKQIYLSILCYRAQAFADFYGNFFGKLKSPYTQYFEKDIISLSNEEVFVDCGAYTGDTYKIFLENVNSFKHYYAFEPDEKNFSNLRNNTQGEFFEGGRISLYNVGVSNESGKLSFSSTNTGGSKFVEDGDVFVEVRSIDDTCSIPPTFIKMDIEGFELAALQGAKETIKKFKPKLAICIYHKDTDFVEIPQFIFSLRSDYKLYIRHYSSQIDETVAYFI